MLADLQVVLCNVSMWLGLAIFTLEGVWLLGLLEVNQKLVVLLMLICFLLLAVWYVPFKHLQTWNCIIMRNELVVEQPIILDTLTHRIVNEAEQFLERYRTAALTLFYH